MQMTCAHVLPAGLFQVPFAVNTVAVTPTPVTLPPILYGLAGVPAPVTVIVRLDDGVSAWMTVGTALTTYGLPAEPEPVTVTMSPAVIWHEQELLLHPHRAIPLTRFSSVRAPASGFRI